MLFSIFGCVDSSYSQVEDIESVPENRFEKSGFPSSKILAAFIGQMKQEIERDDAVSLASKIHYPIFISLEDGDEISIKDSLDFVREYRRIFTPNVKEKILEQPFKDVRGTSEGVTMARGLLWVSSVVNDDGKSEIKVITVNGGALAFFPK